MTPRISLLPLAAALACGPTVALPGAGEASTGDIDPSSDSTGASATTSSVPPNPDPPPQTTTDPIDPTTGGSDDTASTSSGSCDFICDSSGGVLPECDIFLQNCPRGEKCTPWANDGGNSWNATRCSPIPGNPGQPGEPCTVEGSAVSGIDSCDLGSMCWDVDAQTSTGICTPHCIGSPADPSCADPNRWCSINGDGTLALCLPTCDPLADSCPEGQGCYPADSLFICGPDGSGEGGGPFEACEFVNGCDPGTVCVSGESAAACDATNCCTPLCSLETPDCPDTLVCIPWYEEGKLPPDLADIGYCADADWDGG